ncbi:hypothetical protein MA9V1_164 [Chryseobacterium phage MA9V-1]|nr:hypothetical protein MA9V1_164 [Chryseobacterium phage MA9V-1]WNN12472.1 hypothetical protein MA9V2_223 [Chryseobacterium phage MA9V-2]
MAELTFSEKYKALLAEAQNKLNVWCNDNIKSKGLKSIKLKHEFIDNGDVDWYNYDELTSDGELLSTEESYTLSVASATNVFGFLELIDELTQN